MASRSAVVARMWFGLTGIAALVATVIQLYLDDGTAVVDTLSYFTIDSNIIVLVVSLSPVVFRPLAEAGTLLRLFRFVGLICIVITGVVYHVVLAKQHTPHGIHAVVNFLLHTFVPLLYTLGWLIFGPRGWVTRRIVALAVLPPVGWLVFTFVRGAIVHRYPYTFLDVGTAGYARSLLASGFVAVVYLALGEAALLADRRLPQAVRPGHGLNVGDGSYRA